MTFQAAYPWAIVYPCHPTNRYSYLEHGGIAAWPRAMIIHTPEETADGYPGTPAWFATYHADPNQRGSTYYFVSYQLDERRPGFTRVYQCVDEMDGAIANGLNGKPRPAWATVPGSLNWLTNNVEVEGKAASIHQTLKNGTAEGEAQWRSLVDLCLWSAKRWFYPLDREHHMGHYELSVDRSDPGPGFPWEALIAEMNGGTDVLIRLNALSQWFADPAHQTFGPGTVGVNATVDFHVPPEAVAVEAEIYLADDSLADVDVMDGNEGASAPYAFRCPAGGYMHGRVNLEKDPHGSDLWFHLKSTGIQPTHLSAVGIVGYYTQ